MKRFLRDWAGLVSLLSMSLAAGLLCADLGARTPLMALKCFGCFALCNILAALCQYFLQGRVNRGLQLLADAAIACALLPLFYTWVPDLMLRILLAPVVLTWVIFSHGHMSKAYSQAAGVGAAMAALLVHLAVAVAMYLRYRMHQSSDLSMLQLQGWAVLAYVPICAALLADISLLRVTRTGDTRDAPPALRRASRITVLASTLLVLCALVLQHLQGLLNTIVAFVRGLIHRLVAFLFDGPGVNGAPDPEMDLTPGPIYGMGTGEDTWGGWWVLEAVVLGICMVALLVGLVWLLRHKLPELLRRLAGFFTAGWQSEDAGFVDTDETLAWQQEGSRGGLRAWWRDRLRRKARYSDCTDDTQRLRYWYARLLEKLQQNGREAPAGMTPLELARRERGAVSTLCRDYSAVRYGQTPATAAQVQQARAAVEGIKERK